MTKGFVLTLDALLSLLLFALILISIPRETETANFTQLIVFQKIHDLEKIWSCEGTYRFDEMISDAKKVFPANDFELQKNEEKYETPNQPAFAHAISSCFDSYTADERMDSICLTVHY